MLLNHIVEGRFLSDAIGSQVEFSTFKEGSSINLSSQDGEIIINGNAMVTSADNDGVNGVFHVIDSILFPDMD
ncbi:MAG: fasciclin domain-containing protein [Balneolia bacterium]|nr:fasciclin domain-containing protein [Balneolia bacterium]